MINETENILCFLTSLTGIPRYQSGDVWIFLRSHMEKRKASFLQPCPEHEPYAELIKHLTTHQHAILIDLGTYLKEYLCSTPIKHKIIWVHILSQLITVSWQTQKHEMIFITFLLVTHLMTQNLKQIENVFIKASRRPSLCVSLSIICLHTIVLVNSKYLIQMFRFAGIVFSLPHKYSLITYSFILWTEIYFYYLMINIFYIISKNL